MYFERKQNRYGNVAQSTVYNGVSYHSKKEAAYAAELDLLVRAKEIKSWDRQVRISLDVNGFHICNYIIDFVVHHNDGTEEYVEVKGFQTEVWRLKWRLFEALYEDKVKNEGVRLTIVK